MYIYIYIFAMTTSAKLIQWELNLSTIKGLKNRNQKNVDVEKISRLFTFVEHVFFTSEMKRWRIRKQ